MRSVLIPLWPRSGQTCTSKLFPACWSGADETGNVTLEARALRLHRGADREDVKRQPAQGDGRGAEGRPGDAEERGEVFGRGIRSIAPITRSPDDPIVR